MKPIIVSLLTVGTTFAGYTAYQSGPSQFAPLVSRLEMILPSSQAPAPTYSVPTGSTQPSFVPASVQAGSVQVPAALQVPAAQAESGPTYVELLTPHMQAAFAALEADRGSLSEEPVQRLREWFVREREREEAREAIVMVDRLIWVMRERERFRERIDNHAGTFSDDFFKDRINQEWLARIREIRPSFDHEWAIFAEHEARLRERIVAYHHDREFVESFNRDEYRPRYGEHLGSGYVFAKPGEWGHHYPIEEHHNPLEVHHTPLEVHHNPLEAHHNPLEAYHNPLETNHNPLEERHNPLEVSHNPLEEHHNPLERGPYHNPLETNTRPEIGSTNHPTTGGTSPLEHRPTSTTGGTSLNHPVSHPTTIVHPTTVVVPVAGAGGA
jgi:hypothetical protein